MSWQNWSRRLDAQNAELVFLRSEDDARALAKQASARAESLRVTGAGHSHAPLVPCDGIIADCSGMAGILEIDTSTHTAWVGGGTRIYALGHALQRHGLGLKNQGDIDQQAIAGATATGTHGTGAKLQNLSASVVGMRLACADGEIHQLEISDGDHGQACRLNLGALGIVTAIKLQLREAYRLQETSWRTGLDELLPEVETHIHANRHFEFFWYPRQDLAVAKTINETASDPIYPVGPEGSRCAWSYEVLPNHRPTPHTEMEYSVPAAAGLDCLAEIRDLLQNKHTDVGWPVEYRTLAADDVWLSSANGRDTVTISVHQDVAIDERSYYEDCEAIFRNYNGRPHWGKVNYMSGKELAAVHPDWDRWWQARDQLDPTGIFLNPYLKSIRP